jgi:UDP-N-acetylmuramate dehydrogenase
MGQPFKKDQDLSKYHTYGIHAKAKYLTEAKTEEDLLKAIEFAQSNEMPFLILGRGSNVLFRENLYNGLAIINKMNKYEISGTKVYAQSGVNLPLLCRKTANLGLKGLEPLVGVPGTVGGSVFMNAGVLGHEISTHLTSVRVLQQNGMIKTFFKDECGFTYRNSIFHDNGGIVLSAEFLLTFSNEAKNELLEHLHRRIKSQPIEMKNSGCIFKNPAAHLSAGKIIDSLGLKGMSQGGARVCTKHANFINNHQNATFDDVFTLIQKVREKVFKEAGVELECEVRII